LPLNGSKRNFPTQQALSPALLQQTSALRTGQIIALRFAGDDELEELVSAVPAGKLTKNIEIKGAIRYWRPDTFRVPTETERQYADNDGDDFLGSHGAQSATEWLKRPDPCDGADQGTWGQSATRPDPGRVTCTKALASAHGMLFPSIRVRDPARRVARKTGLS